MAHQDTGMGTVVDGFALKSAAVREFSISDGRSPFAAKAQVFSGDRWLGVSAHRAIPFFASVFVLAANPFSNTLGVLDIEAFRAIPHRLVMFNRFVANHALQGVALDCTGEIIALWV